MEKSQLKNSNIEIIKVRQQCNSIDEAMKWPRVWEEAARQRVFLAAMRVAYARRELADFTLEVREGRRSTNAPSLINLLLRKKNNFPAQTLRFFVKRQAETLFLFTNISWRLYEPGGAEYPCHFILGNRPCTGVRRVAYRLYRLLFSFVRSSSCDFCRSIILKTAQRERKY